MYEYITAVKKSTDIWLKSIDFTELKRKFDDTDKNRIKELDVVSPDEQAIWLVDYWCNKNVKGLIQMPISRHRIMHIEASIRIKNKLYY